MSACVLPIAPEFQDPPAAANYSPVIIDSVPAIGMVVMATPASVPTFTVTITDPNIGDNLHVRFIADFPPFTGNTRTLSNDTPVPHRTDGMQLNADVSVTPSCIFNLAKIPQHQIMAIVADRPFDTMQTTDPTKLQGTDGHEVLATWTLDLDCP